MDVRYLLLLFLLAACLPQGKVSKGSLTGESGSSTTGGTSGGSTGDGAVSWNYLSALSKTITINVANLNNSYIVGAQVEDFLSLSSNLSLDYCLVGRYKVAGQDVELRSRVVPISYYDFTDKKTVRLFRVDFNDLSNSESLCNSTLPLVDENDATVASPFAKTSSPQQVCSTCSSVLTSTEVALYIRGNTVLKELSVASLDLTKLTLSIDPNNYSSTNPGTCSQSECSARGFDCCLDNQCITDGSIRSSAETMYTAELRSVEAQKITNPLVYLNYPHLYYICGSSVPSTTTGGTGGGSYEQGLTQLKKDYFCIEHMKKYKVNSTFHLDLLNTPAFPDETDTLDNVNNPATLYSQDIECRTSDTTSTMYYQKVAQRLYQNCGCAKTVLSEMIASCPAYDYTAKQFDSLGVPAVIECFTPDSSTPATPSQQTISVNSRSAPHRYFRTCGDEYGSKTACATGDSQEGDAFQYLDSSKILHDQKAFSMNAILGQMKVTLDEALPAKTVNVQFDQVYQISTTSGFYTACPTCAKDSWFSSFSFSPSTAYGVGLQSVGFTTQRDTFSTNLSAGNYEDTVFGRACWLPPTMIPFSYITEGTTQEQRLLRLKTQSALFANGYQRDWYGFNKGAMIGSFDGVTWFAVGKGRIVRATSNKLFLAINAPFADLASPTLHVVNVQAYDGITQATQLDYDPAYSLSHAYQNEAGTCQANHMCDTDTDCVTRLGWEYMCADVKDVNTKWPSFDDKGVEIDEAGDKTSVTLDQILHQKRFPSGSTKRCTYRGAGSLCAPNVSSIVDLNKRKTLTCAPNFYCANIYTSGAAFNSNIARYAGKLEDIPLAKNHYFGKDANIMGRPLHYVANEFTTGLPSDVRKVLNTNLKAYESSVSGQTGICLPGKGLPDISNSDASKFDPLLNHAVTDSQKRTDFISQIGSCNAGLFSPYRYSSCPVIGADGNYEIFSATSATWLPTFHTKAQSQNSCGLDTLQTGANLSAGTDTLALSSPFKSIESKILSLKTVYEKTLVQDACLRRPGQVCHTDLDCSPNKMHAEQAENSAVSFFGNEAEKKYYTEYLVCGQADAQPLTTDTTAYKNFKMNKNLCCREIGSDLSTYTADVPLTVNGVCGSGMTNGITVNGQCIEASTNGLMSWVASGTAPTQARRYSRLTSVANLVAPDSLTALSKRPPLSALMARDPATSLLYKRKSNGSLVVNTGVGINASTPYQWATLGDANSNSCCGGGWIRKFSDGGNNWSQKNRVFLDVSNFSCLNSRNPLLTEPILMQAQYGGVNPITLVNQDYGSYCLDATGNKGNCAQYSFASSTTEVGPALDNYKPLKVDTGTPDFKTNTDNYFSPLSADYDSNTIIDYTDATGTARRNISIKIPSFVSRASFDSIVGTAGLVSMYAIGASPAVVINCSLDAGPASINDPLQDDNSSNYCPSGRACCISYNSTTRVLKAVIEAAILPSFSTQKVGLRINTPLVTAAAAAGLTRQKPGNDTYYLKRLGLLELSGVPQITYEPLTCSDNAEALVSGLFKAGGGLTTMDTLTQFKNANYSFNAGSGVYKANMHSLATDPVFSANDFKCCTPLGKTANSMANCCSGFGTEIGSTKKYTCGLPDGADLMVYFNRFISNEGRGTDQPGGGLEEADFSPATGEPLLTTLVNQKISALGNAFCKAKQVRQGGAFGSFALEPSGNFTDDSQKIYSIVDSTNDLGQLSNAAGTVETGYNAFMNGFRWNHHLYCEDSD